MLAGDITLLRWSTIDLLKLLLSMVAASGIAGTAVAASVNGPNGTYLNGWYKDSVTASVNKDPLKPCGVTGIGAPDLYFQEGVHTYAVIEYADNGLSESEDGKIVNTIDSACDETNPTTIWSEVIKLDKTPPALTVLSPSNNTNTGSSTVTVTGTVSDTGSGVAGVSVNGKAAAINGSNFDATVPLVVGLNGITVQATDNVGHVTAWPQIAIFRATSPAASQGSKSSPGASPTGSPTASASPSQPAVLGASSNNGAGSSGSTTNQSAPTPMQKTSLVKGATYGGIGVVTLAAIALVLFLLTKFGIITVHLPKFRSKPTDTV